MFDFKNVWDISVYFWSWKTIYDMKGILHMHKHPDQLEKSHRIAEAKYATVGKVHAHNNIIRFGKAKG